MKKYVSITTFGQINLFLQFRAKRVYAYHVTRNKSKIDKFLMTYLKREVSTFFSSFIKRYKSKYVNQY